MANIYLVRLVDELLAFVSSETTSYKCDKEGTVWVCDQSDDVPSKSTATVLVRNTKVLPSLKKYGDSFFMIGG